MVKEKKIPFFSSKSCLNKKFKRLLKNVEN